nr:16S rRNA (guanine(527)-N(7))-methyltransferase RsmG [Gammaproteobacteria bacterium]
MKRTHEPTAEETLSAGLAELGVFLSDAKVRALLYYLTLLETWNRAYNLTAVREPVDMVRRHLLDSLTALPYVRGSHILDLGTGAGFPGMVIALSCPDRRCVLLDKNAKKTRFCLQVIAELGINNVEVVRTRAEEYQPRSLFSTVVARAFGPLSELLSLTRHWLLPGGCLIAMKGTNPQREIDLLPAPYPRPQVIPLHVPGLDLPRHLIILEAGAVLPADPA